MKIEHNLPNEGEFFSSNCSGCGEAKDLLVLLNEKEDWELAYICLDCARKAVEMLEAQNLFNKGV